jgi:hypothetical protein
MSLTEIIGQLEAEIARIGHARDILALISTTPTGFSREQEGSE